MNLCACQSMNSKWTLVQFDWYMNAMRTKKIQTNTKQDVMSQEMTLKKVALGRFGLIIILRCDCTVTVVHLNKCERCHMNLGAHQTLNSKWTMVQHGSCNMDQRYLNELKTQDATLKRIECASSIILIMEATVQYINKFVTGNRTTVSMQQIFICMCIEFLPLFWSAGENTTKCTQKQRVRLVQHRIVLVAKHTS